MNRARIEGHWKQLKGRLRERWGRWTDDELAMIEGRREQLSGRIQERYGIAREKADEQIRAFAQRFERSSSQVTARERAAAGL